MSVYNKTPMARKAARSYCRRCLAVMLCCVLAFGFAVPTAPRAKAFVATATIAGTAGGGAAFDAIGTLGTLLMAAVGIKSVSGIFSGSDGKEEYSPTPLERGQLVWNWLSSREGEVGEWCAQVEAQVQENGVLPGDLFTVPSLVAEQVKYWALDNFDFVDGVVTYEDYALFGDNGSFVLTTVNEADLAENPNKKASNARVLQLGNVVRMPYFPDSFIDFTQDYYATVPVTDDFFYVIDWKYLGTSVTHSGTLNFTQYYHNRTCNCFSASYSHADYMAFDLGIRQSVQGAREYPSGLVYSPFYNRYYLGYYVPSSGTFYSRQNAYYDSPVGQMAPAAAISTMTKMPTFDEPIGDTDLKVKVPATAPVAMVGDVPVAVPDVWSPSDVLVGNPPADDAENKPDATGGIPWEQLRELLERLNGKAGDMSQGLDGISDKLGELPGAISDAVSGSMADALADSMAGVIAKADAQQQTVENSLAEPDDLGAVFISRFPFCIPWDFVKAIKLLAAPPVTPRWELDFMAPIASRVGGWRGDTTVVLDFDEYPLVGILTRWTSSVLFVYALISGTKRLIWTA